MANWNRHFSKATSVFAAFLTHLARGPGYDLFSPVTVPSLQQEIDDAANLPPACKCGLGAGWSFADGECVDALSTACADCEQLPKCYGAQHVMGNRMVGDEGDCPYYPLDVAKSAEFCNKESGNHITDVSIAKPGSLVQDKEGNVYVADVVNNRVRMLHRELQISTAIINYTGAVGFSGDGDWAVNAQIRIPDGLAIDSYGAIYVIDYLNQRIRRIEMLPACTAGQAPACDETTTDYGLRPGKVFTVVGNGFRGAGCPAGATSCHPLEFELQYARAIVCSSDDNLYFSDGNNRIWRATGFNPTKPGWTQTQLDTQNAVNPDRPFPNWLLNEHPEFTSVEVFIGSGLRQAKIDPIAGQVLAGNKGEFGAGKWTERNLDVALASPWALKFDSDDTLYIVDSGSQRILISPTRSFSDRASDVTSQAQTYEVGRHYHAFLSHFFRKNYVATSNTVITMSKIRAAGRKTITYMNNYFSAAGLYRGTDAASSEKLRYGRPRAIVQSGFTQWKWGAGVSSGFPSTKSIPSVYEKWRSPVDICFDVGDSAYVVDQQASMISWVNSQALDNDSDGYHSKLAFGSRFYDSFVGARFDQELSGAYADATVIEGIMTTTIPVILPQSLRTNLYADLDSNLYFTKSKTSAELGASVTKTILEGSLVVAVLDLISITADDCHCLCGEWNPGDTVGCQTDAAKCSYRFMWPDVETLFQSSDADSTCVQQTVVRTRTESELETKLATHGSNSSVIMVAAIRPDENTSTKFSTCESNCAMKSQCQGLLLKCEQTREGQSNCQDNMESCYLIGRTTPYQVSNYDHATDEVSQPIIPKVYPVFADGVKGREFMFTTVDAATVKSVCGGDGVYYPFPDDYGLQDGERGANACALNPIKCASLCKAVGTTCKGFTYPGCYLTKATAEPAPVASTAVVLRAEAHIQRSTRWIGRPGQGAYNDCSMELTVLDRQGMDFEENYTFINKPTSCLVDHVSGYMMFSDTNNDQVRQTGYRGNIPMPRCLNHGKFTKEESTTWENANIDAWAKCKIFPNVVAAYEKLFSDRSVDDWHNLMCTTEFKQNLSSPPAAWTWGKKVVTAMACDICYSGASTGLSTAQQAMQSAIDTCPDKDWCDCQTALVYGLKTMVYMNCPIEYAYHDPFHRLYSAMLSCASGIGDDDIPAQIKPSIVAGLQTTLQNMVVRRSLSEEQKSEEQIKAAFTTQDETEDIIDVPLQMIPPDKKVVVEDPGTQLKGEKTYTSPSINSNSDL